MNEVHFRFHETLNDFLERTKKNTWITYRFMGAPAVKDAIESLGVPHPEVDLIKINNAPASWTYLLQANDQVEIFPARFPWLASSLQAALPAWQGFVLDVHLGKLAKALRLLGQDTCYQNHYSDQAIAEIAARENRVVLTRDVGLLKQKVILWGYWLRSQLWEEQLTEVIRYFRLTPSFKPFSRCLTCNGILTSVAKETVWEQLPPKTKRYFDNFFQCQNCRRVYWKGSHYDRMLTFINRFIPLQTIQHPE